MSLDDLKATLCHLHMLNQLKACKNSALHPSSQKPGQVHKRTQYEHFDETPLEHKSQFKHCGRECELHFYLNCTRPCTAEPSCTLFYDVSSLVNV